MPYTVVYTYQGLSPKEAKHAGGDRDTLEWRSHSGSFGVAYAVNVGKVNTGFGEGLLDDSDDP
jgi:hypothetical protein